MADKEKIELSNTQKQQICFYVLRVLWLKLRGRGTTPTIYKVLEMSRPRYERIIRGQGVRITEGEYKKWNAMGFPKRAMSGAQFLEVPYLPPQEWSVWLELLQEANTDRGRWNREKKHLNQYIYNAAEAPTPGKDFGRLCDTIVSSRMRDIPINERLSTLRVAMYEITLEQLLGMTEEDLLAYEEVLELQRRLAFAARIVLQNLNKAPKGKSKK